MPLLWAAIRDSKKKPRLFREVRGKCSTNITTTDDSKYQIYFLCLTQGTWSQSSFILPHLPKASNSNQKQLGSNYKVRKKSPYKIIFTSDTNFKCKGFTKPPSDSIIQQRGSQNLLKPITLVFIIITLSRYKKKLVKQRDTQSRVWKRSVVPRICYPTSIHV